MVQSGHDPSINISQTATVGSHSMKYLSNPESIRKCLVRGLNATASLDAAVAFIGTDWADILGTFSKPVRLVCWLSSTNTNPYAVEQMMQRENICVTHLPAMHAKVYPIVAKGRRSRLRFLGHVQAQPA